MTFTGNDAVDAMGKINISGNITPHIWYQTILKPSTGKPHLLAIAILSDIVYWYRPSEIRDEVTGQLVGWRKKFKGDILQKSYTDYASMFGESKRTVKEAIDILCTRGVIEKELKTITYGSGVVANNVMFIKLCVDVLYDITFPVNPESAINTGFPSDPTVENGADLLSGTDPLLQKNVPPSYKNLQEGGTKNCRRVLQKNVGDSYRNPRETPTQNRRTNTNITTENTLEITPSSSVGVEEGYRELIRKNISLDDLYAVTGMGNRALVTEIFELMCEIVSVPHSRIRINGTEYPYEVVKSRFLKLGMEHIQYVLEVMNGTTDKIGNIKAYLTTVLFNSLTSESHYYMNLVQHDMAHPKELLPAGA